MFADAEKAYLDQSEYGEIQKKVNAANSGAVEIVHVKSSTKDYFAGLQAGADSKKKTYWYVRTVVVISYVLVLLNEHAFVFLYQLCRVVGR
jgi:hypothetical protein